MQTKTSARARKAPRRFINTRAMARTLGVVGSVMVLVGGVTFAALQSQQAVVKGNTIQTAVAGLKISMNGTDFFTSMPGYSFSGMIPGKSSSQTRQLFLKNTGETALASKVSLAKPVTNPDNADLSKVHMTFSLTTGAIETFSLAELTASASTGGTLLDKTGYIGPGQTKTINLQVAMDADAVHTPSVTLSDIDLNIDALATL